MLKPAPANAVISSGYGERAPILTSAGWTASFHHGIDYKVPHPTSGLGVAFPVTAVADGTVIRTGFSVASVGANGVTIQHEDGVSSFYGHMRYKTVNVGDRVKAGDVIGVAGREGYATGIHLHFEILRNPPGTRGWLERSNRVNPNSYMTARPNPPEAPANTSRRRLFMALTETDEHEILNTIRALRGDQLAGVKPADARADSETIRSIRESQVHPGGYTYDAAILSLVQSIAAAVGKINTGAPASVDTNALASQIRETLGPAVADELAKRLAS